MMMKRLIKTQTNIEPFKIYQIDDIFTVEEDDVVVHQSKHQHLCTSEAKILLSERRRIKNEQIFNSIQELKVQGIL